MITACFVDGKDHWERRRFKTLNFSLILRGRGEFRHDGKVWEVKAPCVLTQIPGEYVEYGPPIPDETWDELYVIYDAGLLPAFQQCQFVDRERPVWPIADLAAVYSQIDELRILAKTFTPETVVDQVDRVCERLVLSTWLRPQVAIDGDPAIQAIMAQVRANLAEPFDLEAAAAQHGMSLSTFQRRWAAVVDTPPARYLQQLRLREACRLLAETPRLVGEIAHAVGFPDELYFSRRFHEQMQMTPLGYRKLYLIRSRGV